MTNKNKIIADAISKILFAIGENPNRDGLLDTPNRVSKAWFELARGYTQFSDKIQLFPSEYDGMVIRLGIPFTSTCEHHLLQYFGTIDFSYVPNGKVIGLSKIIRIFRHYSARLSMQEDLTKLLIERFNELVNPRGCAIRICATHTCESSRGVTQNGVPTITFYFSGVFLTDKTMKELFLNAIST